MGTYDILLPYVDRLAEDPYGEWSMDTAGRGTIESPMQMPFVVYSPVVEDLIRDVHTCWERSGLRDYVQILADHGIELNSRSMSQATPEELPSSVLVALLLAAVRAEKFCDGALLELLKSGHVQQWLAELKEREETVKMTPIKLNDLLRISADQAKAYKVKFNQEDGLEDPMELYLHDPEIVNTQWLFWRNKIRYFNVGQIAVCFLKLSYDTWLLTTIKRVTKELDVLDGINYEGEEIAEYSPYFGRVIVKYHKKVQTQGMYYNTVSDELEVLTILPTVYDGDEFPGYDKVRLSYEQLAGIIAYHKNSWVAALENQKAVYLITDKSNGKLYVGSATSKEGMLLARWMSYAQNGHGGNTELIKLIHEKGFDHVKKYFQYSILENYNAKVDDKIILERESWWKETLQSKKHGYNDN